MNTEYANVKVLVVDNEIDITDNLKYPLRNAGFQVYTAFDGDAGLLLFRREKPDVVILDILMPGINGLKLLDIIKREAPDVLVIMLTSRGLDEDIERGLEGGADRYLVKQTTPSVVVSNVKAMLRSRAAVCSAGDGEVEHGLFKASLESNRLEINSVPLECTLFELKLMFALIRNPHKNFKRDDLLGLVYGEEAPADRSIDQLVKRIRRKACDAGVGVDPVRTVPTIGYKLGEP